MMPFFENKVSSNQKLFQEDGHVVSIKREDLIHPQISGNKYRKLKYNLLEAQKEGFQALLTFGGAFSNHLLATAIAGKKAGFATIGVVRGEEWKSRFSTNPTLSLCYAYGMQLYFLSRTEYKQKEEHPFVKQLLKKQSKTYLLPEGGTNKLAIRGCQEILTAQDKMFDTICCSVGTAGTLSGLIEATHSSQCVLGFNALRNPQTKSHIEKWTSKKQWHLINDYTFGGYAKVTVELIQFLNTFYQQFHIPLDPIYTGKMVFGIFDLIKKKRWKWGENILIIHTGGLQGILGMNQRLLQKGMPLLDF